MDYTITKLLNGYLFENYAYTEKEKEKLLQDIAYALFPTESLKDGPLTRHISPVVKLTERKTTE